MSEYRVLPWRPLTLAAIGAIVLAALPFLVLAGTAYASSFQINPILIELHADKGTAILTIENQEAAPVSVRIQARSWTQQGGEDVYGDASDLIFSPPIATIAGNSKQIIRIGQRRRMAGEERAYRVIVEEIPTKPVEGSGVAMALRFDLPMYILAPKARRAELQWKAWRDKSGRITVEAVNSGTTRAEVLGLGFEDSSGKRGAIEGRVGVVLAHSAKRWAFDQNARSAPGGPITLLVRTEDDEKQIKVALQDL